MRDLKNSAAYRIAFIYSAAFALAMLCLGALVYFAADAAFRAQQDTSLIREAEQLKRGYGDEGLDDLVQTLAARPAGTEATGYRYALFDRESRRIVGRIGTLPPLGLRNRVYLAPGGGARRQRTLATPLADGRILVIAVDREGLERIDNTILALFGIGFLVILLIGCGGALILGAYLRARLARIGATAEAIVAGDMERRVPVGKRGDEFDQLATSVNAMLDRIELLLTNLRQVSSDVAHDLRTPLARLRNALETSLEEDIDPARQREMLRGALEQSEALLALFGAMLRIAEVEAGELAKTFVPIDIGGIAADLCEIYTPALTDGGRRLECAVDQGLTVLGDRELIAQALVNLLSNAQKHTPPGTRIGLRVQREGNEVCVVVSDNGPGVPAADRERVTRRFVRLEQSRSTPGHGLGLNLVSAIAGAHGGRLIIGDNAPGLSAAMVLPLIRG